MAFYLFLFLIIVSVVAAQDQGPPMVKVPHGVLQGIWKVSTKGRAYASFQGVPYARPPIGKYRFMEPQRLKPWPGVWDATRPLPACLQFEPFRARITGNEDCLYVNVHSPELQPDVLMPVMVFIHGGAFMFGQASLYDPSNFMDWNMVIVTVNYRLGPLGFLSTGDDVVPGNNGLKDQSFALHWIKKNIMRFGGDPNSITLTGCSAGAASVHYHYMSPLSRGTFARGIAFSGSALSPWAFSSKPAEKARTLATIVGCPTRTSKEIVECLKYRPASTIANAQVEMSDWKVHLFTPFTPVVEAPGARDPFLQQHPYYATKSGFMMSLPLIISVTSEEGLYPAAALQSDPYLMKDLEARWDLLAPQVFEYNDTLPLMRHHEVTQVIKQHYLGGKQVTQETFPQLVKVDAVYTHFRKVFDKVDHKLLLEKIAYNGIRGNFLRWFMSYIVNRTQKFLLGAPLKNELFIQALSDRLFFYGAGKLAQFHATESDQPTYVYKYAYRSNTSFSNLLARNYFNYGVSHLDDVLRVFHLLGMRGRTDKDDVMTEILINIIYSFASTGIPKLSEDGPTWLPVKPGKAKELDYLNILGPNDLVMRSTNNFGQKLFWDKLGLNEGENYHT